MKKFFIPVIGLVNLILSGICFGLGANTAAYQPMDTERIAIGNFYQLVWPNVESYGKVNVFGIVTFFLFVVAVFLTLITLIPFKARKCVSLLVGAMFIAAGAMTLMLPQQYIGTANNFGITLSGSLIGMATLMIIAGGLSIVMAIMGFATKKED